MDVYGVLNRQSHPIFASASTSSRAVTLAPSEPAGRLARSAEPQFFPESAGRLSPSTDVGQRQGPGAWHGTRGGRKGRPPPEADGELSGGRRPSPLSIRRRSGSGRGARPSAR